MCSIVSLYYKFINQTGASGSNLDCQQSLFFLFSSSSPRKDIMNASVWKPRFPCASVLGLDKLKRKNGDCF